MASLRCAISASALETLAAARAAAASALAAFACASMRAARSKARSRLRLSKSSGRLSIGACEWSTDRVIRDLGIDQMSQNVTGSSRRFGLTCALRVPPIDALKHVSELGRCNHNNALGWRGPDELTALKPLGIKRHAESIVPKHFYQIAPAAAKHKEIAGMRIALQCFLYLKS